MQLVDQCSAEILPYRRYATSDAGGALARGGRRLLESDMNPSRHEVELGSSGHLQQRPWMMGEHEDRRVVWRLPAPPSAPALIRPGPSPRAEHVAPENPGTDYGEALGR